ncbi:hypothetical protein T484DRAFT_1758486, partial [Baffinella frigidus]
MNKGVHIPLKIGDKIPGVVPEVGEPEWMHTVSEGWGYQLESDADTKLREKQAHESNEEEQTDNALEQRKVSDNEANKAAEKAAAKKRKKGRGKAEKLAMEAEKLATEKIEMAEAMKVAERAAKADKLDALAAIAVNNLVENPSNIQSTGIPREGCTCFFNVLLQVLFAMPYVLSNILQMDNSKHDDIITALQNVFLEMSDTSKGAMVEQETLETFFYRFKGFDNEEDAFNISLQETPAEAAMKLIERCQKAAVKRGLEGNGANWFKEISSVTCETIKTNCQTGEVRVVRGDGTPFLEITLPTMGGSVQKDLIQKVKDELAGTVVPFKWAPEDATEEETAKIPDLPHKVAYKLDSITKNIV